MIIKTGKIMKEKFMLLFVMMFWKKNIFIKTKDISKGEDCEFTNSRYYIELPPP